MIGIVIDVLERAQLKTLHSLLDKAILRKWIAWLHVGIVMSLEDWNNQLSSDNTDYQVKILEVQSWKAVNIDLKLADILRYKMFTSGIIFQFEQIFWATHYAAVTPDSPCYNQENLF